MKQKIAREGPNPHTPAAFTIKPAGRMLDATLAQQLLSQLSQGEVRSACVGNQLKLK